MDKSFNDQELSDIMKEIEALEDGFHKEDQPSEVTEVLGELTEMKEHEAIPLKSHKKDVGHHPAPHSCMSFKVSGELKLDLQFDVGGQVISMHVTESGLHIEMDGGMTFTVPLKHKSAA